VDVAGLDELGTQRLAHVGHVFEVVFQVVVDPLHHLFGAIRLLADLHEEITQTLTIKIEQVDLLLAGDNLVQGIALVKSAAMDGRLLIFAFKDERTNYRETSVAAKK
jgi:hypothetical protein